MVKRAIVAGLLLLVPGALHLLKQLVGAPARYYGVLLGGLLLGLVILALVPLLNAMPIVRFALGVLVCLFPPLVAGYSLQALTTASPVPWWISLPMLALSALGILFVLTAILVSGGGYIVG
jgi:hypothetical protein